jgi:phenylpyruvate tautomerase PptA (4-oxalocrotonate tautomerase family)
MGETHFDTNCVKNSDTARAALTVHGTNASTSAGDKMPILDIEIVGATSEELTSAQPLANAAAEVLKTGPSRTWVKVRGLKLSQYAENGGMPAECRPVFVSVLVGTSGNSAQKSATASGLAAAVARVLGRPAENVHILFEPDGMERVAFGGKLKGDS